jgi:hypothetical protein
VLRLDLTPPRILQLALRDRTIWKQVIFISRENTLERLLKECNCKAITDERRRTLSYLGLGHRSAMTQLAFSSRMEES